MITMASFTTGFKIATSIPLTAVPFILLVAILIALLAWALRSPRKPAPSDSEVNYKDASYTHVAHLPQIQRALHSEDFAFVASLGLEKLSRDLRRERFRIALDYLPALRTDFQRLLHLARVIAVLSPDVAVAQEWERLRLSVHFYLRYEVVRFGLRCGVASLPQLAALNQTVSAFSSRMENAMKELGERAVLAAELASSMDRRGVGV